MLNKCYNIDKWLKNLFVYKKIIKANIVEINSMTNEQIFIKKNKAYSIKYIKPCLFLFTTMQITRQVIISSKLVYQGECIPIHFIYSS